MKVLLVAATVASISTAANATEPKLEIFAGHLGRYIAMAKSCGEQWDSRFTNSAHMVTNKYSLAVEIEWSKWVIADGNIVPPCDRKNLEYWRGQADRWLLEILTGTPMSH